VSIQSDFQGNPIFCELDAFGILNMLWEENNFGAILNLERKLFMKYMSSTFRKKSSFRKILPCDI
jgi:hypothetical protein